MMGEFIPRNIVAEEPTFKSGFTMPDFMYFQAIKVTFTLGSSAWLKSFTE